MPPDATMAANATVRGKRDGRMGSFPLKCLISSSLGRGRGGRRKKALRSETRTPAGPLLPEGFIVGESDPDVRTQAGRSFGGIGSSPGLTLPVIYRFSRTGERSTVFPGAPVGKKRSGW